MNYKLYRNWSPTPYDQKGVFMNDNDSRLDWGVLMIHTPKTATLLDESNWETAQKRLKNHSFEIISVGHWATDIDILLFDPKSSAGEIALHILSELEAYPILDDIHYSNKQDEAIYDYWETLNLSDRIELCKDNNVSIFASRHDSIHESVYDYLNDMFY